MARLRHLPAGRRTSVVKGGRASRQAGPTPTSDASRRLSPSQLTSGQGHLEATPGSDCRRLRRACPSNEGQRDEAVPGRRLEPLAALDDQLTGPLEDSEEGLWAPENVEPRAATTQRHKEKSSGKNAEKEQGRPARKSARKQRIPTPGRSRGGGTRHWPGPTPVGRGVTVTGSQPCEQSVAGSSQGGAGT